MQGEGRPAGSGHTWACYKTVAAVGASGMSAESKDNSKKKTSAEARRARLEAELRANLLKRKAQAKAKQPPRDRNEGRQS